MRDLANDRFQPILTPALLLQPVHPSITWRRRPDSMYTAGSAEACAIAPRFRSVRELDEYLSGAITAEV